MANLSVIFNMVDNISNKLSSLGSGIDSAANSFQRIEQEADSAFDGMESGAEEVEQSMESFADSMADGLIEAFQEMSEEANLTEDEMRAVFEELPGFFRGMADGIEGELTGVDGELNKTETEVEELGEEFNQTGKKGKKSGEEMKDGLSAVEGFLAAAGIVAGLKKIADAYGECAERAEETEYAFAKLETIAGAGAMGSLQNQIASISSELGVSQDALADVAYNAISAGTAVEDAADMAESATKLATAGFTDSASALSVLTTAINAYGDSAGTATEIADSLITVQNLGVTTVADLSANMGKAIATASAYNVSLDNLESSYISITKAGINTAEGTTYISSMLKELGTEGSSVAKVLEEETGESFAQLMADGYSLADVLGILYTACDNDATALMNLWGSAEAGKASNAIVSQGLEEFNDNLVTLQNSAGATADAFETMSNTTEFAHQKMTTSVENFKIAVGDNLNPVLTEIYGLGSSIFDTMASITEKCPALTALITAGAVAVGVLAVAITGYTVATKVATAAEAAYSAMLETSAGAMTLKLGLVGAITAALAILAVSYMATREEEELYTASTEELSDQLDDLNQKHAEAVEKYGEESQEAQDLQTQIDALGEEYESTKMTLEEFYATLDKTIDSHDEIVSKYQSTRDEIASTSTETDKLITRLQELEEANDGTSESQATMEACVKRLSQLYPELGITIEDVNGDLDTLIEKINGVNSATKQTEYENAQSTWTALVAEQEALEATLEEAGKNLDAARERYSEAGVVAGTYAELTGNGVKGALDQAQDAYDRANDALEENKRLQEECMDTMEGYTDVLAGTSEETVSLTDAMTIAAANYQEEIEALAEEYQAAYDAALTSIEGQWSLWETADEVATASIEDMNAAMESQTEYWNNYADNLESLHARNIEGLDEMVASMDDGSSESAAYLQAMSEASDEELAAMVANFENLQEAQSSTADTMAELETDFSARCSEIEADFTAMIENMNMDTEAAAAASSTIQAYINQIKSMKSDAVSAASDIASSVSAALNTGSGGGSTEHHAAGTLDSGDVYIAGEKGQELILSGGHDTVFPASETEKIVQAVQNTYGGNNEDNSQTITDESNRGDTNTYIINSEAGNNESTKSYKEITLEIKGAGSIQIDGNATKESVWETIKDNIKSSVMSILSEEIYEGSEGAYEF